MTREVVVVTGTGGMGVACARRLGPGRKLVLAEYDAARLQAVTAALATDGFDVTGQAVDVADARAVAELANRAAALGSLRTIVHTAGISSAQVADAARIYAVDLLGTAHVLDAFLPYVRAGTVAVVIASMAGHFNHPIPAELEERFASAPTADLLAVARRVARHDEAQIAYGTAKRANILRVRGMAAAWGRNGGRVVSISPGVIATPMGRTAMAALKWLENATRDCPAGRAGTPDDIAHAAAWLASAEASYITGADILIDGGAVATRGLVRPPA